MKAPDAFAAIVTLVGRRTGLDERASRDLLYAIGEAVAREVVTRGRRVVWLSLGTFRSHRQKARRVSLVGLKRVGNVPASSPGEAQVPALRKLRFRPSRRANLWRGE